MMQGAEPERTLDFLLRHAIHAVLTHRLFAEADESFSRPWDLDLVGLGLDSGALGMSCVAVGVWSDSSILVRPSMSSSEMQPTKVLVSSWPQ